jgi:hypothetical protein
MPDTVHTSQHPENPAVRHETTDVDFRRTAYIGAGIVVLVAVLQVGLWWLMNRYEHDDINLKGEPAPVPFAGAPRLPAGPRLEGLGLQPGAPGTGQQAASLGAGEQRPRTPTPADESGVTRIPIEKAMDLLVRQHAGQARQESPPDERPPADSNSGRFLKREKP